MFKKIIFLFNMMFLLTMFSQAQVGIGISAPNVSSMLDITSSSSGILIPRMTSVNRTAISTPAQGLLVYDTDKNTFWYYYGSSWHELLAYSSTNTVQIGGSANYSKIETDGTLEFVGDATVWNEFVIPASSTMQGTNPPVWAAFQTGIFAWHFLCAGGELSFSVQMPRDWKEGSAIIPQVHWAPMSATAGDVTWKIGYTWANNQETFPATLYDDVTTTINGNDHLHMITSFSQITHPSTQGQISSILMITLTRFPGTTYQDNAALLSFDILYESNTLGSRTVNGK